MPEDLIDFRTSPLWQNFYYDQGLTPHPSTAGEQQNLKYWQMKVEGAKREYEAYKIDDEAFFESRDFHEEVKQVKRKYEARIEAMERHINYLMGKLEGMKQGTEKHAGIKHQSPWLEPTENQEGSPS